MFFFVKAGAMGVVIDTQHTKTTPGPVLNLALRYFIIYIIYTYIIIRHGQLFVRSASSTNKEHGGGIWSCGPFKILTRSKHAGAYSF
jgi:hypothetical protein